MTVERVVERLTGVVCHQGNAMAEMRKQSDAQHNALMAMLAQQQVHLQSVQKVMASRDSTSQHPFSNARNGRDYKKMLSIAMLADTRDPEALDRITTLCRAYMDNYIFHDKNDGDWEESFKHLMTEIRRVLQDMADRLAADLDVVSLKSKKSKGKREVASSVARPSPPPWQFPYPSAPFQAPTQQFQQAPAQQFQQPPQYHFQQQAQAQAPPVQQTQGQQQQGQFAFVTHEGMTLPCNFCSKGGSPRPNCFTLQRLQKEKK